MLSKKKPPDFLNSYLGECSANYQTLSEKNKNSALNNYLGERSVSSAI